MFDIPNAADAVARLENCLSDIGLWMLHNKLKQNADKTVALLFRVPSIGAVPEVTGISIGGTHIACSPEASNLGVLFDQFLNMEAHISRVCRTCFYHISQIGRIRRALDMDTARTVVQAFVMSKIDYCNSLLTGLPDNRIARLQRVQNAAARVVARKGRRDHITPVLQQLHWLPVAARITYKVLVLAHQGLHNLAPDYISELIIPYTPERVLRSASQHLLREPPWRLKLYGKRRFASAAARLWNSLPPALRSVLSTDTFKKQLKTHLFLVAFGPT